MVSTQGITDTIKSFSDLEKRCNLRQASDDQFFREWVEDLPELQEQEQLWILLVESKRTIVPVPAALPQLLAYMLATPQRDKPAFGVATNGDEFVFLKLITGEAPQYDVSRTFSLFPRRHELGEVLRIMKRLGQVILE